MITEELFEECIAILQNPNLLDEEQSEKVETLIAEKTSLTGTALENATLDVLWRHRDKSTPSLPSPIPVRHTIIRSRSPAPWQMQIPRVGTPNSMLGSTPPLGAPLGAPPGFPPHLGAKSPFPSPRPSPRLAFASPLIPHSPSLSAYEFAPSETPPPQEIYGDSENENVSWLVNEEANRDMGNMSPHDMLRSVLGEGRSDEEIERALEAAGYDLSAAVAALMGIENGNQTTPSYGENYTIIGKSTSPQTHWARPSTPKNGVVCRFFLSTGQCLRADCRFSHDLGKTICKYWVMGNCLAGDTCIFSHDPTISLSKLGPSAGTSTPPSQVHFHDPTAFPSLTGEQWTSSNPVSPPPGFKPLHLSRPASRQQNRDMSHSVVPQVDDTEAFPSLGSAPKSKKNARRNHNVHTGQGSPIPTGPSSLADVVRMGSPSPAGKRFTPASTSSPGAKNKRAQAASSIPPPTQIPWLETGNPLNKTYLKHRGIAIKHGGLRNKYLQAAAAAWNRNDAKSAKSLSLRGANENESMRKAHRTAAQAIYEERNKHANAGTEVFVDLHGLHPEEACEYLERILLEQQNSTKPLYAIIGSGHHAKGGKDKIGKAVRAFLDEWKYVYREFSISGATEPHGNGKGGYGGILGIDPTSYDKSLVGSEEGGVGLGVTAGTQAGNVKMKDNSSSEGFSGKKEPPKGPSGKAGKK